MNTMDHIRANSRINALKQKKDEKFWAKYYKQKLLNVLAVTHRDGGHYTEKHGIEKSTNDAIKIIADAIVS